MAFWHSISSGIPLPTEAVFRTPSVVVDLLLIHTVYRWTAKIMGPVVATYALVFLAFMPLEVEAARTARPYIMFALWTFLALSGLIELITTERKPSALIVIRMVVGLTLALYTHYYGWLVLAAASALLLQQRQHKWLPWLALPVILYIPWIPVFLRHLQRGNPMIAGLTVGRLVRAGAALLVGQTAFLRAEGVDYLTILLVVIVFGFAVTLVWRALVNESPNTLAIYRAFVFLLFMPIFASLFIHAFEEFYLVMVLPFLAVLLAIGAARSPGYRAITLFVALLFTGGIYPQYSYEHQAWREVALAVQRKIKPRDIVVYNIWFDIYPAHHYLREVLRTSLNEADFTDETFTVERMEALLSRCQRLILVGSFDRNLESRRLRSWLIQNREQLDVQIFAHTFLEIYACARSAKNSEPHW